MAPQCTVDAQGQLSIAGVASSNSSGVECWFALPSSLPACKAVSMKNLIDPEYNDARLFARKLRVNWGHASAAQIRRILAYAYGVRASVLKVVESVVDEFDVCAGLGRAPHLPIASTSRASASSEKVQVDLRSLGCLVTPHTIDLFSRYSTPVRASSKNPLEVWGALAASRITVLGKPGRFQWAVAVNGEMKYGRTGVRNATFAVSFRARAPIPCSWHL